MLATLLRADAGTARIDGYDVIKQAGQVRRTIGLTGQYASVDEDLTGIQNLVMIGTLLNLPTRDAKARAAELLDWFDLADAAQRRAKTYSGGMRRRLDLAASLVGRPRVIFLDEPTTGLDPAKREDMWEVVRRLVADGSTVLLTTQYLEEADALADEITVIDHGRVIAHDTPEGLKRTIGGQRIRVRPADRDRLADVGRILAEISGTTRSRPAGTSSPQRSTPVRSRWPPPSAGSPPRASASPNCPCTCPHWMRSSSPSPAIGSAPTTSRTPRRTQHDDRHHHHIERPACRTRPGSDTRPRPRRPIPGTSSPWPSAA